MRTNCAYTYGSTNPNRYACYTTADIYGAAVVIATGQAAKSLSDSEELKAAAKSYERYVESQTGALIDKTQEFVDAVKAGKVAEAKALFPIARTYWERIEPVAETFGDLDSITDGREPDVEPGADFTGWHRIEKQLWVSGNTVGMDKYADQLLANVKEIVERSKTAPLTALQLAQGSKGLLDEVATGKITGEEDGKTRFGLVGLKPDLLSKLPRFPGDKLQPGISEGDIALQACANDPQIAVHAIRNLLGYKDGTANIKVEEKKTVGNSCGSRMVTARTG